MSRAGESAAKLLSKDEARRVVVNAPGPLLVTKLPRRNVSLIVGILAIRFYSRAAKTGRAEFRSMPSAGNNTFPHT
jgi:hypothetical protein